MSEEDYKHTVEIGKVAGEHYGYKRPLPVTIEIRLQARRGGLELTMMGNVWRPDFKDILSGGQNYNEIAELFPDDPKVQRMVEVWRRWHLNAMRAGCEHQRNDGQQHVVGDVCPIDGYRYGSAWLYEPLPAEIVAEVRSWR